LWVIAQSETRSAGFPHPGAVPAINRRLDLRGILEWVTGGPSNPAVVVTRSDCPAAPTPRSSPVACHPIAAHPERETATTNPGAQPLQRRINIADHLLGRRTNPSTAFQGRRSVNAHEAPPRSGCTGTGT
jgi:hypothetical protein